MELRFAATERTRMNLDLIYNIRPAIEEGLRGWFTAQSINAFTRQNAPENFETVRPRVEIDAKVGAMTGHKHVTAQGVLYNDTFGFELTVTATCDPQNTEAANVTIDQFVARIRGMMQTFGQATWTDTANFPNHLIVEPLKDTSTADNLKSDDNQEWSELTFSGIVQIRTNSWTNT